jgi:predicted O-methyltransferase YrrM
MKLKTILEDFQLNNYTDKNTTHCYVDSFYEEYFLPYQEKSISLLEIGISLGASLKLWKEYFINAKTIIGIDNRPEVVHDQFRNIEGVTYYFEDAYSESIVSKLPKFDIIIDDADHCIESQIKAIELYLPLLKRGGLYVVEDIDGSMLDKRHIRGERPSYLEYKQMFIDHMQSFKDSYKSYEWLDFRHVKGRPDDSLLVIKK